MSNYKTARGVFLDLSKSDIITTSPRGSLYKFSSYKRQEIFIKKLHKELANIDILFARVGDTKEKHELVEKAYRNVYDSMTNK